MAERMGWGEFWPFYLGDHSKPATRALHLAGTAAALACIALALIASPWFWVAALLVGYAFAWVAHFAVERNRPATFTHPVKSFVGDWRMFALFVTGRLGRELRKHGLK